MELAAITNPRRLSGELENALRGADVLLGLSGATVAEEAVASMAPGGIVFALSNPDPEIHPQIAARYAAIVATGRSDFPNQINNVLAFPGIFRGALDAGARRITEGMKLAAADAIAAVVADELSPTKIVPSPLDPRVGPGGRRRAVRRSRHQVIGRFSLPSTAQRIWCHTRRLRFARRAQHAEM
jgi:malate dehydrogenase (oxaloacetate-decarboxylating)